MGIELDLVTTTGAKFKAYLAAPKEPSAPGVIVLQEWWGLVPHIRAVCDRLAAAGFFALAPDLYHGETTKSPDDAERLMMAMDIKSTALDLHAAVRQLTAANRAFPEKIGIVGFCMGGQLALYAASQFSEVGVCVDFYGIHPKVRIDYTRVRCPVVGLFAEKDAFVTPEVAKKLESDLKSYGVQTDFTVFPGASHAFFNDTRPEVYNKEAADKAWDKMIAAFRRHLSQPSSPV